MIPTHSLIVTYTFVMPRVVFPIPMFRGHVDDGPEFSGRGVESFFAVLTFLTYIIRIVLRIERNPQ